MRTNNTQGTVGVFRMRIGTGMHKGIEFDYCITTAPDGTLLGMLVVTIKQDGKRKDVVFELDDIITKAFEFAGIEVPDGS